MLNVYAGLLTCVGRPEEAIPLQQKAIRLSPHGPSNYYRDFGNTLRVAGRFEEAVSAHKKAIQLAPDDIYAHSRLAATYVMMGQDNEARAEAAEVLRINPKFSLDYLAKIRVCKDTNNLIDALRKAGLK
jgi:adenylate cyclase